MKAIVLTGIREMDLREVPTPCVARPTDVLVRVRAVGVCGSDVHYYTTGRIGSQVVQFPFTVGHECAGEVVQSGTGVTRVRPGDRVAIEPAMTCGACDQCLAGRANTCRNIRFLGCPGQAQGCLSEYLVMPEACCFPIEPGTTFEQATISEPLAIGVYAVQRSVPMAGAAVGILGMGPIGMCVMLPARNMGARRVYGTDLIPARLAAAARAGADYTGSPDAQDVVADVLAREQHGLDVVFECCGKQAAIDQAIDLLKPGGTLMLVGIPEVDRISFVIEKLRRKEISIRNVRRQEGCVQHALDMIQKQRIDATSLITHRFALADAKSAFDLVAHYRDGVMKAMIHLA